MSSSSVLKSKAASSDAVLTIGSGQHAQEMAQILAHLNSQVRGKPEIVELCLSAMLAGGHVLLEGPPGTGKTRLARALAGVFHGSFKRIQMTSDLLPSDIVGILRASNNGRDLEFRPGPIFSNVLLADELNRTSPKTQSALLEAMAEGTVTVDGVPYPLPNPFFVVATQNPGEFQGVYPLAESQLDRFMIHLTLDTPGKDHEREIYLRLVGGESGDSAMHEDRGLLSIDQFKSIQATVSKVHVEETVLEYCLDLVRATRFRTDIAHGVSVRGGLQMLQVARARAFIKGREFVIPEDVRSVALPSLAHRIYFSDGERSIEERRAIVQELLEKVQAPK